MNFTRGMLLMLGALAVAAAAPQPKVRLFQQDYVLSAVDNREAFTLNQYVMRGESVRLWTRMLTVMHAPKTTEPATAAKSLLKSARGGGLLVNEPEVMARVGVKMGDDLAVLLVFKDPKSGQMEYNMHRFVKEPAAAGVKSYQFACRFKENAPDLPKAAELGKWLEGLFALEEPVYLTLAN